MDRQKETRVRHTASDVSGKTEISVEAVMYGMTDEQEKRVRELLKVFWEKNEQIAAENEGG